MSTKDALPVWLRTIYIAINDAPFTNIKSLNALLLADGTALFLMISAIRRIEVDQGVLDAWLIFLAGMIGFAMVGAGVKRATYKPAPPNPPDIEDIAATTATPSPDKVLTKDDADKAAKALEANQQKLNQGEEG